LKSGLPALSLLISLFDAKTTPMKPSLQTCGKIPGSTLVTESLHASSMIPFINNNCIYSSIVSLAGVGKGARIQLLKQRKDFLMQIMNTILRRAHCRIPTLASLCNVLAKPEPGFSFLHTVSSALIPLSVITSRFVFVFVV
jgi:hypothetical protein